MLSLFSPTTVELIDVRQVARRQDVVPLYLVEQGAVTQLLASMLLSACVVASQRWLVSVIAGGMTFSSGKCCRLIFRGVGIRPSQALGLGNDRVVDRRSRNWKRGFRLRLSTTLSVTLFCLKINSIIKAVCPGVDYSLYVDDFLICYRSKHIHIIERHIQRSLNKLQEWAYTNGFKFSSTNSVCLHFCRLRKLHPDPQLFLNGCPIPVVEHNL